MTYIYNVQLPLGGVGFAEDSGIGFERDCNELFLARSLFTSPQLVIIIVWQILVSVLRNVNKTWPLHLYPINTVPPSLSSCLLQGLL